MTVWVILRVILFEVPEMIWREMRRKKAEMAKVKKPKGPKGGPKYPKGC